MNFSNEKESPSKRLTGIGVAIAIHVIIGFLVVSGMGKRLVEQIKNPVETKIIEEVKPPPPVDLPPPPPPPEIKSPPPPFIPPPEVVVQPSVQAPVISNTTSVAPKQTDVRPQVQAPAPVATAPPAPPAEKPAPPAKTPASIKMAECGKPDYPKNAARNEEEGTVEIRFLIDGDGKVKNSEITRSSGSRELDKAAVAHLTSCNKFRAGTENGKAVESSTTVAYQWKLE